MPLPPYLDNLDRRVLRQLGGGADAIENAKDAARHGADAGFGGFIATWNCVRFFRRNRAAILGALASDAADCGTTAGETLAGFRCLRDVREPLLALANPKHEDYDRVATALAWYALERTGNKLLDNADEEGRS